MSGTAELLLKGHNYYHSVAKIKASQPPKSPSALRLGILGAAAINPITIFDAIATHPSITLTAIAARRLSSAEAQITKYKLTNVKAYSSYSALLEDSQIQAVYIPVPNGLHAEWTIKALQAGKHVLCEKPLCNNASEAREIVEAAGRSGKVVLEAFHWRFHPAAHRAKELVDGGRFGRVLSVSSKMVLPKGMVGADDIRFKYELGGGACMDLTYVFSAATYFAGWDLQGSEVVVKRADARLNERDEKVDEEMRTEFIVKTPGKGDVQCYTHCSLAEPLLLGIVPKFWGQNIAVVVELEKATITFDGFASAWLKHSIVIEEKDESGKVTDKKETETCYVGGPQWAAAEKADLGQRFWTTYRYQIEGFVDMVRAKEDGGEYRGPWIDLAESEKLMGLIDAVYDKAGLPRRGKR